MKGEEYDIDWEVVELANKILGLLVDCKVRENQGLRALMSAYYRLYYDIESRKSKKGKK